MIRTSHLPAGFDHCVWLVQAAPDPSELATAVANFDPTDSWTDWDVYKQLARFMQTERGRTLIRARAQDGLTRLVNATTPTEYFRARSDLLDIAATLGFHRLIGWRARDEFVAVAQAMVGANGTHLVVSAFQRYLELALEILANPTRYRPEPLGWHPAEIAP
jgi:hypothetical protein